MVFASPIFLCLFLSINLIFYFLFRNKTHQNILLTFFSLVFYAWGEPVWVLLLVFSASVDYFNALLIEYFKNNSLKKKIGLVSSIIINLGVLIVFKYSGFIYENINFLFDLQLKVPSFSLPIGISFYTFQTISYVVDVYRGEVPAQKSYLKFLMFVSLFHQLVAGPIVRYAHIADEIENWNITLRGLYLGIQRFCMGLFKKVMIANIAGQFVEDYLNADLSTLTIAEAWFGILMYSIQIYFDFSGYSDMAIGLGWMFGFHYHENFHYPYIATSATDFWRRWHISLGSFFRDYVYIPLGGNRKRMYFNLFVVWFLTGLWHGASWNFIFWGLYFGVLIAFEKLFLHDFLKKIPRIFSHIYLIFAVVLGWALFYFTDLQQLGLFLKILFGIANNALWNFELGIVLKEHIFWMILTVLLCLPVYHWVMKFFEKFNRRSWATIALASVFPFVLLLISISKLVGISYNPFIYFRF